MGGHKSVLCRGALPFGSPYPFEVKADGLGIVRAALTAELLHGVSLRPEASPCIPQMFVVEMLLGIAPGAPDRGLCRGA